MNGSSIILNHVSVKFQGTDVLKDISFALKPREHLAVTGASGSGKTTLAKVIAGHLFAQGNVTILWDESSPFQKKVVLAEQRNRFKNLSNTADFYYQQRFNSFDAGDSETVRQALENSYPQQNQNAVELLMERLGLYERAEAPLIQLSSGENKRFQLIRAILSQSQILILDSPFTGLDATARKHLNNILSELTQSGTKLIITTDLHQIPDCITHVAILKNGELESYTKKEDTSQSAFSLFGKPLSIDVNSLPATANHQPYDDIISMHNVHIQYGDKTILHDINWKVKPNEKWLLKGANGAGKSTLLSLINGDNPQAYKNKIHLFGKRRGTGESIWDIKNKIGYVSPELHAFYDKQTSCFNTIASGFFDTIGLFKKITALQHQQVKAWIDALDLQSVQDKSLTALSFSTQRMILLARALVKDPVLLILDEPCQGLDDEQRDAFVSFVNDLSERFNKTLIYVSHYDSEVPECITNVLELTAGNQKIYKRKRQAEFA